MPSRHLIMGTSGHVDHGKTALIRLLTGIDTDRLKEERERGISIELGFAHFDLPDGTRLGIVDVPGHERFVKHMLAGAGGIDFVLFVVAADEGVMPQTVEHCQILEMLGVERGVIALTKIDMVDADFIDLVEEDLRGFLESTPFAEWPVARVSSTSGEGREALIETLVGVATEVPMRSSGGRARLPIDRVFSVQGFGTVVTGTLWSGSIAEGDRVAIKPAGIETRVRQVQMHGAQSKTAEAGSRVALALHAVDREDIARGDWVVPLDFEQPTSILDVRLETVDSEERPMKQRERVRFHLGASEVFGRVTLFDRDELTPGDSAVAQIRLEESVVASRGDRFVLRWYSPIRTAAGGRVIDAHAAKRRRSDRHAVEALNVLDAGTVGDRVISILDRPVVRGMNAAELAKQAGASPEEIEAAVGELAAAGRLVALGKGRWVGTDWRRQIDATIEAAAREYQERFPLRYGIPVSEVRSRLKDRLQADAVDAAIRDLAASGLGHVRDDRLRIGAAELELTSTDRAAADAIIRQLEAAKFAVPATKELLVAAAAASDPQELLVFLAGEGEIIRLTPDLCYTRRQLDRLEAMISDHFRHQPELAVADFKDLVGVSRKYAVPLLEYLDNQGLTRRSGDNRVPGRRLAADEPLPRPG